MSDLADAHILALDYLLTMGISNVFNLDNGHGYSVRQVVDAAAAVTGCNIPCLESDRRPGDPPILIGDSEKIRKILGWNPILNQLDTIIETAWQWQKKIS